MNQKSDVWDPSQDQVLPLCIYVALFLHGMAWYPLDWRERIKSEIAEPGAGFGLGAFIGFGIAFMGGLILKHYSIGLNPCSEIYNLVRSLFGIGLLVGILVGGILGEIISSKITAERR